MSAVDNIFNYIDKHQDEYVKRLADVVAIKSVSAWADHRPEVKRMVTHMAQEMESLGCTTELVDPGRCNYHIVRQALYILFITIYVNNILLFNTKHNIENI